jgi:hypothetical protein
MATKAMDYSPIVLKLLEKTDSGRVEWRESPPQGFRTDLYEGFYFLIDKLSSRGDTTYTLTTKDSENNVIFSFSLIDDPDTMINRESLYDALSNIYELARRKALKLDEKVERVSEVLERI